MVRAYDRRIDGQTLEFRYDMAAPSQTFKQKNVWNFDAEAIEGPMRGKTWLVFCSMKDFAS